MLVWEGRGEGQRWLRSAAAKGLFFFFNLGAVFPKKQEVAADKGNILQP